MNGLALALFLAAADTPAPVGTRAADFTRTDAVGGRPWSLVESTRGAKATALVFLGTGCPASVAYSQRLGELHRKYAPQGVVFVGVNSHPDDDAAAVAASARKHLLPFPVLKDDGTALADKFAVDRIPCVVLLDATRTVRYAGRIDDQFAPGVHRSAATTRELANALDAVLEGAEVKVPFVAAKGCKITRAKTADATAATVTFHKHVVPVLQAKCQECHRAGEAAPFALTTYKTAKNWADMLREVVADDVMPPWHADAAPGHFKNDRRLTAGQKKTLLAWVDQGCPEGDPTDAPPTKTFLDGWRLSRTPDTVWKMNKPIQVPASSLLGMGVPYQYVDVGEPLKADTWVTGVEVRPEYRAAVHHIIAFIIPPDAELFEIAGGDFGRHMLGAYVPGDEPVEFGPDFARKLVKGSRIVFEMHYTPNGKAGTDQSVIGLLTTTTAPKYEVKSTAMANNKFALPPGDANHPVKSAGVFDKPVTLLSLTPHMHLRGKAFRFELVNGEKREVLLNVPRYDFNWQPNYTLAVPRTIPAGSRIECSAVFDNSAGNPFNPDPSKRVRWGNQTWEEMMIGFASFYDAR